MSVPVAIHPEKDAYNPGDTVSGTVVVVESASAHQLELTLEYRDATSDYVGIARTVALAGPLTQGDLQEHASFPFSVALPADALPNCKGVIGLTTWGLHAQVVRTGFDANMWHPIDVLPHTS
jgi:hypothetical protein